MVARLLGDLPRLFLFWLANVQVLHHIAMMGRLPIGPSSKSKKLRWVTKSRSCPPGPILNNQPVLGIYNDYYDRDGVCSVLF